MAHGPAHDVVEDDCGGVSGEAGEEAGPGGAPADARHGALSLQAHDRLLEVTRVPDVHLRSQLSTSLREVSQSLEKAPISAFSFSIISEGTYYFTFKIKNLLLRHYSFEHSKYRF